MLVIVRKIMQVLTWRVLLLMLAVVTFRSFNRFAMRVMAISGVNTA
jgi:hypothetical protein